MMKKTVVIDEDKNQIRYYEKDPKSEDYLDTILKYLCTSTDNSDDTKGRPDDEYMILKNGKRIQRS